ncbi:cytochrome P450 [Pseudomassariella vexata]|uniref:Cytochrome P450 n=1 Tax=Pseudomassariella vexata TaxID=1141098 RepID=A0A1Y2E7K0_9PEZI|nr:cytochrome P450 [Pseudomassariella vexata]ORY67553.1 cytochrome P450 [Pseudomassariella vexata]
MDTLATIRGLSWQHVAASIFVYFTSLAFYQLFLHPLSRYPGPKLAAITRYYEAYYDVICHGQYTWKIAEMHKKYGPIIRISPYELHINDPAYFEKLYRQDGRWNKYAWSYTRFHARHSTVFCVEHDVHRRRRAPLNAFFSKANVNRKQAIVHDKANKLCYRLAEFAGSKTKTVNLSAAVGALVRDVATEFILGKDIHNLDMEDFNISIGAIFQGSGILWRISKHAPWFGPLMRALPFIVARKVGDEGGRAFLAFRRELTQLTKDIMASASDPESPRTVIHDILASSSLPPEEKTFERVYSEIGAVTGAAFETTAHALRIILYYVYTNPTMLRCLRAELAEAPKVDGDSEDHTLSTLKKLPYLTAVIMEGLRLGPGNATRMARIAPDRDLMYGDWRIPAGTPVGMTTILMHMDERLYPEPDLFEPDRWMDAEVRKKADKTFAPFSRGTRNCGGMQLAWAELYMVIAALVQRFDFEFDGAGPKDVVCASDRFIIGTADSSGIKAFVAEYRG